MTMGANALVIFEQLGLLGEIEKMSLPLYNLDLYNANMEKTGSVYRGGMKEALHELLLRQIPPNRISYGKKILRTEEKEGKVIIHCSDKTSYQGDILVGADGAYSGVRQSLYQRMDKQGRLPKRDLESFSIGYVALFGMARIQDHPEESPKYPQLKDNFCHFSKVLGGQGLGWSAMSVPDNHICWSLGIQLSEAEAKAQQFRNSEWGPESNEVMVQQLRELPCPWGGSMSDIVDATPKHLISKVFLEEKLFSTWHEGRTVLIGDGLGASNAFQDAVVLANCLYTMADVSPKSITAAFQEYYRQRYHRVSAQYEDTNMMAKSMLGQKTVELHMYIHRKESEEYLENIRRRMMAFGSDLFRIKQHITIALHNAACSVLLG
ncbi:hypothetical protein BGX34_000426 [Mortierella sp. NVP85]|nr:hypothetical protein BGX34_000426 [Mortierella sp. NVP85]